MHGHYPQRMRFGRRRRRFPNADELLRLLEEHQRDLEQEAADVAELIRRLKDARPHEATTA